MKFFYFFLFFAVISANANALDCNENYSDSINFNYICNQPGLRKINRDINRAETQIHKLPEHFRKQLQYLQEEKEKLEKASQTEETAKKLAKIEQAIPKTEAQIERQKKYVKTSRTWINKQYEKITKCEDFVCIETLLKDISHQLEKPQNCEKISIQSNCEVYFYKHDRSNKSEHIFVSDKYDTYADKLRINRPGQCVYLILSADFPVVFDIFTTEQTDLKAIIVNAPNKAMVRGYPQNTKIVYAEPDNLYMDSEDCLTQLQSVKDVKEALELQNYPTDKIKQISTKLIGENTELQNFKFYKENITGQEVSLNLIPGDRGWQQLVSQKKLRRITQDDIKKLEKSGIVNIDNNKFIFTQAAYKNIFFNEASHELRNAYLVLENIEELPQAGNGREPIIFIPYDITPPDNLKVETTFKDHEIMPMFNRSYIVMEPVAEIRKW